ncbi:unnamed protein product [Prunus brigantina]
MVGFIDPAQVSANAGSLTKRSRLVANRLQKTDGEQIFMMPYNPGRHWVLFIVRAKKETVYFLDPLPGNRVVDEEAKNILNSAIKMYNSHIGRQGRKATIWKTLPGTSKQPSSVECGYYVMHFMRDIIMDPSLEFEKTEGKYSILKEGVPAKVVWYFPPIPRFKRMFQSHETAKSLTWHAARKSIDGQMSHPADSPSWKLLDDKWPEFGNEPRNLRLALSSDGFNPHNSLNVYLEPLIDDLKSLWDGIKGVYDAHNREYFTLRAALMWTINDFPAYGNLYDCVVKGYKPCPICGDDTPSHRRQRAAFNGKPEYGTPPEPLSKEEVLHMVEDGDRVC